jgi:hypothetical protein
MRWTGRASTPVEFGEPQMSVRMASMEQEGWDIKATGELIRKLYDKPYYVAALQSIHSVWRRLEYARVHYHEAKELAEKYIAKNLTEHPMIFALYRTDEAWDEFNVFIYRVGAKITAYSQDIHAVADILAFALYYSLALDKVKKLKESRISCMTVPELLAADPTLAKIAGLYDELLTGGSFRHVAALVNHSKHRSLVLTSLNEDWTDKRNERHILQLGAFEYNGVSYPAVPVKGFLTAEFDRCWKLGVDIGKELHAVLEARQAAKLT